MSVRKMIVYYEGLSDAEEEALSKAIENITCPHGDANSEHECRLYSILWGYVDDDRKVRKAPHK